MYSFFENYAIFICVNVSEGSFDQFALLQARIEFKSNKQHHETKGTVETVLVYLEFIQKSLIPTRKILSPSIRGRLPVYRKIYVAVKMCRGWLGGIKKSPT